MRRARPRSAEFQAVLQQCVLKPFWLKELLKRGGDGTPAFRLAWDGTMSCSVAVPAFDLDAIDHGSGVARLYIPDVNIGNGTF